MRYIISGSKGLIGERLKLRLDNEGNQCIMEIDQRLGSNLLSLPSYQLTQETQYADIFFHLGAYTKINETVKNPALSHLNNACGTYEALEFCRRNGIKKFVYMSSSRTLSREENPYTASKKYGEHLCEAYKQCYGIDYLIIRPSTVYGAHHDLTTRLITTWVINALKNKSLVLYGDPRTKTLDFTYVEDFVDGIMCLLRNWDRAKNDWYDICGDDCRKLIDVARIISEVIYKKCFKEFDLPFAIKMEIKKSEIAQPQQVKIDISKLKKFGYNPKVKIEEGVEKLVDFYLNEGRKWVEN
jgi:nucleoside-diphosphate-sugar epimerase